MRLSNQFPCRVCRVTFALFMAWIWAGGVQRASAQAGGPEPASPAATLGQAADRLRRVYTLLEAAKSTVPRDTFDYQTVVRQVGREPDALLKWVREQTVLVPYRGALRGPRGVLMDRVGNSLDRSLLLARLLREAGHTVRLAQADLPADAAQAVAARPPATLPAAPVEPVDAAAQLAKLGQMSEAEARTLAEQCSMRAAQVAEEAVQRTADQTAALAKLVPAPATRPSDDATAAFLRDHWWVQVQEGDGWRDLDALAPVGKPALAAASKTIAFESDIEKPPVPEDQWHTVKLNVVVETRHDDKTERRSVFSTSLRPAELIGQRISLTHVPGNWPADLNIFTDAQGMQRLKDAAVAQHEWTPVLVVGGKPMVQGSFDDKGGTKEKANLDALAKTGQSVKKGVDAALDALDPTPAAAAPQGNGELIAEWVELEFHAPGRADQTLRRTVFDVMSAADRAGGAKPAVTESARLDRALRLLGESEFLIQPCQLSNAYVQTLAVEQMLANAKVLDELLRDPNLPQRKSLSDDLAKLKPLVGPTHVLALARQQWARHRGDVYLDRPNVFAYHRRVFAGEGGQVAIREGLDILTNQVALLPGSGADPFAVQMEQGVLDTNAEAIVVQSTQPKDNTSELMNRTLAQGIGWKTVRDAGDPLLASLGLSAEARQHIGDELKSGFAVVLPEKPVSGSRLAWWRVDPQSGATLGMTESGEGAVMVEYAAMIGMVVGTAGGLAAFAGCMGLGGGQSAAKSMTCLGCAVMTAGLLAAGAIALATPLGGAVGVALYAGGVESLGVCTAGSLMK